MNREILSWKIRNSYRNARTSVKQVLIDRSGKMLLQRNADLRSKYNGKRCFVLGNGPSLNLYDLSCLKNEFVFSVNEFGRFDKIYDVNPDIYVIADSKFFELRVDNKQDQIFRKKIEFLSEINPNISVFFPLSRRQDIKRLNWDQSTDIRYFNAFSYFYKGYDENIDLTKMIPAMQNVVQYCILIALYMGFKEIYLLGTDQTNIFGNLRAYISNDISEYAFQMRKEESEWKHKQLIETSLVDTLRGYARIFEIFDELSDYCKRMGVELYNCAPETMISGIPKKDFLSLF